MFFNLEPSAAPVDVVAHSKGSTTILVSWKQPPFEHWNGQLLGFYVGYKLRDSEQPYSYRTIEAKHDRNHNHHYEFFLNNLLKGSSYSVIVKAFNTAGSGPPSEQAVVHLLKGDLPLPPHLFMMSSGVSSVSLHWNMKDAALDAPLVSGFVLHYQKDSEQWREVPITIQPAASEAAEPVVKSLTNSYTLSNLDGGSKYHIYVTATNPHGVGDPSNVVTVLTDSEGGVQLTPSFKTEIPIDGQSAPFYTQPLIIIPIVCAAVIIVIVITVTFVCLRKMREAYPPPDYAGCKNQYHREFD